MFTTSKWDLLQALSDGEASPLELAKKSRTSLANISQQLRLLELAGFVKSRRISNRDKGKPRVVYSLTDDFAFIVVAASRFVEKRFIKLTPSQKASLRCWFYPDALLVPYLESALPELFALHPSALAFDPASSSFYALASDKTREAKDFKVSSAPYGMAAKNFIVKISRQDSAKKLPPSLYALYDPTHLFSSGRKDMEDAS